ncbi:MAG: response regulator, partial [Clostridiales bacterium]|nr:response regulator [Clostridiales bacterium]
MKKRELRTYFMILICGLVIISFALVGLSLAHFRRSFVERQRCNLKAVAQSTVQSVENYLSGCLLYWDSLQETPVFRRALGDFLGGSAGQSAAQAGAASQTGAASQVRAASQAGEAETHARADQVARLLESIVVESRGTVTDICLTDAAGAAKIGFVMGGQYEPYRHGDSDEAMNLGIPGKMCVYIDAAGRLYLGQLTELQGDLRALLMIDADRLSAATALGFTQLGMRGNVMIKASCGQILENSFNKVREGGERAAETIEVSESVPVKDDFLTVSVAADYAEVMRPVDAFSILTIIAVLLAGAGVIWVFWRTFRDNRRVARENEYLRELNRTLKELTERQEQMQHDQRLRLIGTLAGGIVHEFRNVLTPIMGHSGLIREKLHASDPMREDVEEIYSAAQRAKEIIQQITCLSRRTPETAFSRLDLDKTFSRIIRVALSVKPENIRIISNISFAGAKIMGNSTQICQVVLNLCANAFHAIKGSRGHVWINGGIEKRDGAEFAQFSVTDEGEGIEKQCLERIFEPFYTTKRDGEGTGLGLSIVQNIVDAHNGTICVDSEPERGTTFTLRFPVVTRTGDEETDIEAGGGGAGCKDAETAAYTGAEIGEVMNMDENIVMDKKTDEGAAVAMKTDGNMAAAMKPVTLSLVRGAANMEEGAARDGGGKPYLRALRGGKSGAGTATPTGAAACPGSGAGLLRLIQKGPTSAADPAALAAPEVVVVEEDEKARRTVESMLSSRGYDVRGFASSSTAMAAIEKRPCDVLITARQLSAPIGGEALAAQVKGMDGGARVLMLVDSTDHGVFQLIRKGTIDGYLTKPLTIGELADKM